ncbi:MAG: cytochrome c biogenesis protein CcsA [Pseudomonadota bacterium]
MPDIVIHVVASALYAALALHFWNTRWRPRPAASQAPGGLRAWERAAILVPLALQGWILAERLLVAEPPRFGFAFALSATAGLVVLIYWLECLFLRLDGIQPVALGLAALCVPLTAWFPGRVPTTTSLEFRVHMVLAIAAYGVLTAAVLHALLMAAMDRLLHAARAQPGGPASGGGMLRGPLASLPPLLTLEQMLFRMIAAAFVLLTVTLGTGMALSDSLFGRSLRLTHETVFALVAWVAFAILLAGRYFYGWRGRTALRWALAGFMFVVLANIGSTFVIEVILRRG